MRVSVQRPVFDAEVNIIGTINVLEGARAAGSRRLVFAASSSAYGETAELPKTESMSASPISPYGVTKLAGELYAQVFGRARGRGLPGHRAVVDGDGQTASVGAVEGANAGVFF